MKAITEVVMMSKMIRIGDIIKDNESQNNYSVVYVSSQKTVLCLITKSKNRLYLYEHPTKLLMDEVNNGHKVVERQESIVVNEVEFSDKAKNIYQRNIAIINAIKQEYGPLYTGLIGRGPKPVINKLCEDYELSRPAIWRIIDKYLQSGCQLSSLVENRGTKKGTSTIGKRMTGSTEGTKTLTDQDIKYMDESIENIRKRKSHVFTKKDAYVEMLQQHYSQMVVNEDGSVSSILLPLGEYPSIRQYYNYLHKKLPKSEYEKIRTSEHEYRNNHRALTGSERDGLTYPGELCDIDATATDIYLVSQADPTQLVSRGHMYLIIDVLTGMIISGSVSFEDNSNAAVTQVLMNLRREGRDCLLKETETTLKCEECWPADVHPGTLRCDRGSEFVSKEFRRKCKELGITIQFVTAASGSLKGSIEKEFHQFNLSLGDSFEHGGQILKRYDSDHKKTACLNIVDMRKIMVSYIIYHNGHVIESRQRTPEMVNQNISPSPIELWKFYSQKNEAHFFAISLDQFIWSIMKPAKASMTRRGILFKDLHYYNALDVYLVKFMEANMPAEKMDIRYDEASMSHIYYLREGVFFEAHLKEEDVEFADMSYDMYIKLKKKANIQKEHDRHHNIQQRIQHNERLEKIAKKREDAPIPDQKSNIQKNIKVEKEMDNKVESVTNLIGSVKKEPVKLQKEEKKTVEKEHSGSFEPIEEDDPERWKEQFYKKYKYKK